MPSMVLLSLATALLGYIAVQRHVQNLLVLGHWGIPNVQFAGTPKARRCKLIER